MNRQVVLDTNAYSHLFRGDERVLKVLGEAERVYVPVTVIGELLAGFRMGTREKRNREELGRFLAKPTVRVLETSEEVADVYAGLVAGLREAGRKIPTNDVWIAAHAMAVGGVLVSFDAHFEAVAGLRRWRGGE